MPFGGIGFIELLLLLVLFLGVPAGIAFLLLRWVVRSWKQPIRRSDYQQLTTELDAAQLRLEDLEGKLARVEEQARFTESLLEQRTPRN